MFHLLLPRGALQTEMRREHPGLDRFLHSMLDDMDTGVPARGVSVSLPLV